MFVTILTARAHRLFAPVVEALGLRIRVEELCERRVEWALVEKLEPAPLS